MDLKAFEKLCRRDKELHDIDNLAKEFKEELSLEKNKINEEFKILSSNLDKN
jgi:hypothetical protein